MKRTVHSVEEMKKLAGEVFFDVLGFYEGGLSTPMIIGLRGDLGAGKTTFVQEFCRYFNIETDVTSPTYVLQKTYLPKASDVLSAGIKRIHHLDVYRIESADEMNTIGFGKTRRDVESLILIEWPEKIVEILPKTVFYIDFSFIDENTRVVEYNWGNA